MHRTSVRLGYRSIRSTRSSTHRPRGRRRLRGRGGPGRRTRPPPRACASTSPAPPPVSTSGSATYRCAAEGEKTCRCPPSWRVPLLEGAGLGCAHDARLVTAYRHSDDGLVGVTRMSTPIAASSMTRAGRVAQGLTRELAGSSRSTSTGRSSLGVAQEMGTGAGRLTPQRSCAACRRRR